MIKKMNKTINMSERIKNLQRIIKEEFGKELSDEEAEKLSDMLLEFFSSLSDAKEYCVKCGEGRSAVDGAIECPACGDKTPVQDFPPDLH